MATRLHQPDAPPAAWHAHSVAGTVAMLATDATRGLAPEDASERLRHCGRNALPDTREAPWWAELREALTEPLQLLLLAVGVLYALLGELADAVTIFLVILAVAAAEAVSEARATRAIAALRDLSAPTARVVRRGRALALATPDIVPGDLVLLQPGDRVPADLRLVETVALRIDESSLTGESVSVLKEADTLLPVDAELGDRRNLAFAGTVVTAGKGRGVVVATGPASALGRIAALTAAAREPRTPLQQQLGQLAGWLVWLALGFSVLVPVAGVLVAGRPAREMLLTGLTLAFATIPEELPILVTIILGLGAYRLARRQAIVKRLRAAETLGSVSVICTDKTGTLTQNRMRVVDLFVNGVTGTPAAAMATAAGARLLAAGVLANDAQATTTDGHQAFVGDPTETALLVAAEEAGLSVTATRAGVRVLEEYPFDDVRRRMAVAYEREGARWLVLKGAPEAVLSLCDTVCTDEGCLPLDDPRRGQIQAVIDEMAAQGQRLLALAERRLSADQPLDAQAVESHLTFLGLAVLEDPPRPEVRDAIAELTAGGVRVVMLTGDHPATARAIAWRVGIDAGRVITGRELERATDAELDGVLDQVSVFARIAPEHKLRIVRALQARGAVVAVTGDGVNDAPALREAAIGVAMGQRGTDVAREAADMVLADDNFATVAVAVRGGRTLFANLRKAVRYYLAAKVALITASLVAVLARLPVPFEPVQIIVMELFMDLGASTTFVVEPAEGDEMARPPRDPRRPFMDGRMQAGIFAGGLSLAAAVLVAYVWADRRDVSTAAAQTTAFAAWMVGHLVLAAHMRNERLPVLRASPFRNPPFLLWVGGALGLLVLAATVPALADRLHLASPPAGGWAVAVGAGVLFPSWWELAKWVRRRGRREAVRQ